MDSKRASHLFFAVTIFAIGVMGLVSGGFAPIWGVVPKTLPHRELLAYLSTFVSLVAGAGLFARRSAQPAAFVLLVFLIVWTALFKFPFIIHGPLVEGSYQTCGENVVLIAGVWALYACLAGAGGKGVQGFMASEAGLRIAYILYGLALIAFGFSHFVYLNLTAPLVPRWLGEPVFWAYLTGCLYLVSGFGIATGIARRLGAVVAAIEIALITFLVWGPILVKGHVSAFNWEESVVSTALTAAACAVATSFNGRPWFIRFDRSSRLAAAGEHTA